MKIWPPAPHKNHLLQKNWESSTRNHWSRHHWAWAGWRMRWITKVIQLKHLGTVPPALKILKNKSIKVTKHFIKIFDNKLNYSVTFGNETSAAGRKQNYSIESQRYKTINIPRDLIQYNKFNLSLTLILTFQLLRILRQWLHPRETVNWCLHQLRTGEQSPMPMVSRHHKPPLMVLYQPNHNNLSQADLSNRFNQLYPMEQHQFHLQ